MPTSVCKEFPKPNHFVSLKECVGCGSGIPSTEENVDPTQCVLAIFKIFFGPVPAKPNQDNVDQYPYAHYSMHPKIKMINAVPGWPNSRAIMASTVPKKALSEPIWHYLKTCFHSFICFVFSIH